MEQEVCGVLEEDPGVILELVDGPQRDCFLQNETNFPSENVQTTTQTSENPSSPIDIVQAPVNSHLAGLIVRYSISSCFIRIRKTRLPETMVGEAKQTSVKETVPPPVNRKSTSPPPAKRNSSPQEM